MLTMIRRPSGERGANRPPQGAAVPRAVRSPAADNGIILLTDTPRGYNISDIRIPHGGIRSQRPTEEGPLRKALLRNDLQSINGNSRKGSNMDNEHNEMIEKSREQSCEKSREESCKNSGESSCCCGTRHKKRTEAEQKALLTRLRRIEGQIRGLEKMVENDAYCPDILVQSSAATSALNSFNKVLLGCHIRSCVAEDIRSGKDETVDELCELLQRLMK